MSHYKSGHLVIYVGHKQIHHKEQGPIAMFANMESYVGAFGLFLWCS